VVDKRMPLRRSKRIRASTQSRVIRRKYRFAVWTRRSRQGVEYRAFNRLVLQDARLASLDLQGDILGPHAALREPSADEPQALLRGWLVHVAHLAALIHAPDRSDLLRDLLAQQPADHLRWRVVTSGRHHEVGLLHATVLH